MSRRKTITPKAEPHGAEIISLADRSRCRVESDSDSDGKDLYELLAANSEACVVYTMTCEVESCDLLPGDLVLVDSACKPRLRDVVATGEGGTASRVMPFRSVDEEAVIGVVRAIVRILKD